MLSRVRKTSILEATIDFLTIQNVKKLFRDSRESLFLLFIPTENWFSDVLLFEDAHWTLYSKL